MVSFVEFIKSVSLLPKPFLICIDFDDAKGHSLYIHDVLWDGFSNDVFVKYSYVRLGLAGDTNHKEWRVNDFNGHHTLKVRKVCYTLKEGKRYATISLTRLG